MRIHGYISIGERGYAPGDEVAWYAIYPFFFLHLSVFGTILYLFAYGSEPPQVGGMYALGLLTVAVYLGFYLSIFGLDEVRWMLINAALSVFGIFGQISWLMSVAFDRRIDDLPWYIHAVPFLVFVLFTFLVRQAFTDLLGGRDSEARRKIADILHVVTSVGLSVASLDLNRAVTLK